MSIDNILAEIRAAKATGDPEVMTTHLRRAALLVATHQPPVVVGGSNHHQGNGVLVAVESADVARVQMTDGATTAAYWNELTAAVTA